MWPLPSVWRASLAGSILVLASTVGLLRAQEAPRLRYGFAAGREYGYHVKISADATVAELTAEGDSVYEIVSVTQKQIEIKRTGKLNYKVKERAGQGSVGRGPGRGAPRPGGAHGPHFGGPHLGGPGMTQPSGASTLTIDWHGKPLAATNLTNLPCLLGPLEMLLIEELPVEPRSQWTDAHDLAIGRKTSATSGPPSLRAHSGTTTFKAAKEVTDYAIVESRPDVVRISRRHSLKSVETEGGTEYDLSGGGEFQFDAVQGVIASYSMKYQLRVSEKSFSFTLPVTVECQLLTAEALAEARKQREEKFEAAKARLAALKTGAPSDQGDSLDAAERAKLLANLASSDAHTLRVTAERLAKAPRDDRPDDIAKALAPLLSHSNEWVKVAAAKALAVWGTPAARSALVEASKSTNRGLRAAAVEALARLKAETAGRRSSAAAASAAEPELRTWRDASGSFEVEATFVGSEEGKVTLKRKDGRLVSVPLEKLSAPDRTYVEKQAR